MTFADKSRYDKMFQQVTHKGGEYKMNYIKIFQNAQTLSVSVWNYYSEDKMVHIFLDNFHKGGKYSAQIASNQADIGEKKNTPTKNIYLSHPYRLII